MLTKVVQIREDKKRGVFVEGLSEWAVRSPNEVYALMQKGAQCRATATTKMNDLSSRIKTKTNIFITFIFIEINAWC